ncbi:MAG: hypothetical protein JOZ78_24195 [Chroococcidiopsidaceae cyanobacterium CP_BM_ER_R8_30]|nr:hypothetical protein [Chroococcidiopsidaceae cyanobacterium CP_BM_ER_R8_30]
MKYSNPLRVALEFPIPQLKSGTVLFVFGVSRFVRRCHVRNSTEIESGTKSRDGLTRASRQLLLDAKRQDRTGLPGRRSSSTSVSIFTFENHHGGASAVLGCIPSEATGIVQKLSSGQFISPTL